VDELARRVVPADREVFVELAFACNVGAGVGEVAQGALVRGGVAIEFGESSVVELSVGELEKGGTLSWAIPESGV
jgi:hypothetical protein